MAKCQKLMANTTFLTDAGLDGTTAKKLVDYGVTELPDLALIDFEDEDFKKLELNKFQTEKLKKLKEKAQRFQKFKNMKADCREELENKGLTLETLLELDKHGVVNLNTLKNVNDSVITKMTLLSAQREQLKSIIKDLQPRHNETRPGIHVSNVKATYGDITDGATAGLVDAENLTADTPVSLHDTELEHKDVRGARAVAITVKNRLPPKPKDLVLESTDELIAAMSDGPLSGPLNVQSCSPDFYSKHKADAYSMEKTPRGGVLIINVNQVEEEEPRDGTDVDRDKLKELFEQLHFNVTVYNDDDGLTKQEIKDKVQKFADAANKEQGEAYVVCLLSHGEDDCLFGTDGELLPFDTVFSLFGSKRCPNLVDKPKMFIIQACREGEPRLEEKPIEGGGRRDMFVSYATQAGYKAFRDTETGSWLVEAITKVFARYAREEDIIRMMYRVHYAVQKKLKIWTAEDLSPEVRLSLGKPLFFFPGIQK